MGSWAPSVALPDETEGPGMHEGPDTGFHSIRTDRLILRRFSVDDVESFAAYRSDPVVARYQSWDPPFTQDQAQDFVDALATRSPVAASVA